MMPKLMFIAMEIAVKVVAVGGGNAAGRGEVDDTEAWGDQPVASHKGAHHLHNMVQYINSTQVACMCLMERGHLR